MKPRFAPGGRPRWANAVAAVVVAMVGSAGPWSPRAMAAGEPIDGACQHRRWIKVPTGPERDAFHVYLLAAGRDRVYAAGSLNDDGAPVWSSYTGSMAAQQLDPINPLSGMQLTDLLMTPTRSDVAAWASGFKDTNIYGAPPSLATGFSTRGTVTAWPSRLLGGAEVHALFTKQGQAGVYRWDPAAANGPDWVLVSSDIVDLAGKPVAAAWSSATGADGRLWIGTDSDGLWSSADGRTWARQGDDSLKTSTITAIAVSPVDSNRVAVGMGPSLLKPPSPGSNTSRGIRVSNDGGQTFEPKRFAWSGDGAPDFVTDIAFSRADGQTLYAAVYGRGLHVSRDGGQSWTSLLAPHGLDAYGASIHDGFFSALEVVQPAVDSSCELLFAGGAGGLWVRRVNGLRDGRAYLPFANRGNPASAAATASLPAFPVSPRLSLPDGARR